MHSLFLTISSLRTRFVPKKLVYLTVPELIVFVQILDEFVDGIKTDAVLICQLFLGIHRTTVKTGGVQFLSLVQDPAKVQLMSPCRLLCHIQ